FLNSDLLADGKVLIVTLSPASRAWVSLRVIPGVPLRSTPGFMLSPAMRVLMEWCDSFIL
ncbi:MAG: hypothetical protein ACRD6N_10775, partial [Pyrinomonadaceae bacterium]